MKVLMALIIASAALFTGCTQDGENSGAYSEQGGGSMEGAGGAGPGYDGTGSGKGPHGTVPDSGPAREGKAAHSQTNTAIPNPGGEKPVQDIP